MSMLYELFLAVRWAKGLSSVRVFGYADWGEPRRLSFWEPIVSSISTRLFRWKNCLLSFGGRLILLKTVLTYLPVYALSFFKAPSGQEHGGLGVRQLKEFNNALLAKWCWWMLVDKGGMWYRVLAARYGEVWEAGGRGPTWLCVVARIRDGEGAVGGAWFAEGVAKRVGNGADTSFWSDPWLDGVPLCVRYRRLFNLATNQSLSVAEMCELGWGRGDGSSAMRGFGGKILVAVTL
ncbi:hypothetical protein TSUD_286900 [Trifolium subterraneum]|uniref:Reverse transcriptase zinc-binding domain-containing protein n=1 Tax=Trifolium subterraneum TaxID=3900 RepID=A0A2Z6MDU6_TRISU|nr:hypothetical protein TSUD_286900 [Trifolium subterraneum]